MNDFFELEKKCKQLKLKKLFKYLSIFISIIITFLGILWIYNNYKNIKPQQNIQKPKIIIKEKNITKIVVKKIYIEKNITKPIPKAPTLDLNIDLQNIKEIKPKTPQKPEKKPIQTKQIVKKSIIQNETLTFEKALTLAKKYYENEDYQSSIKWCKLASKIDNNDERVWKLYALNLEKTGQRQKAIKVLKTYLKYKNSIELKYLLQRLEE